ncbi:MAG: hypothetical protein HYU63_02075 [Armatimonadetes bacterium]|nr:hypothetical protein [Armatimonadota bacterium]
MTVGLEIDLPRQIYLPGEELTGKVILKSDIPAKNLFLTLHGEEVIGAKNIAFSLIIPLLKIEQSLYASKEETEIIPQGEYPFSFLIPPSILPSFASSDFKCQYYLTCRLEVSTKPHILGKVNITIIPYNLELPDQQKEIEFGIKEEDFEFRAYLEKSYFFVNETMKGNFVFNSSSLKLKKIVFNLRALATSIYKYFPYQELVWSEKKEVILKERKQEEIKGIFGFNLPKIAPFTHFWNTFQLNWVLEVSLELTNGKEYFTQVQVDVYKIYKEFYGIIKKDLS